MFPIDSQRGRKQDFRRAKDAWRRPSNPECGNVAADITGAEAEPGADGGDSDQFGDRSAMGGIRKRPVFYAHSPVAGSERRCVVEFGESFVGGSDELFAIFCQWG